MRLSCLISVPWAMVLYCLAPASAYTSRGWVYAHPPREYPEEDYYYGSKPVQYPYYGAPARYEPEVYGRIPYPYYFDPYAHYAEEDPARQDERLAALPVGQETWYESEAEPRWKPEDLDDVNAAFLDNLILTQMAQDAQRRRENARATVDYEERDSEDEDVRELKALAGKPLYHVPKTVPRHDDEDYPADDAFINWNGNKRSVATEAPTTRKPRPGQDEVAVPQPQPLNQHHHHQAAQQDKKDTLYQTIAHMLAAEKTHPNKQASIEKPRRLDKRFVAGDRDLVAELRGLKHRIAT